MNLFESVKRLVDRARPPVGITPADVIFRENKWRLLRYQRGPHPLRFSTPVLLVPSLINRHYVLDLVPGRSFAEYLVQEGHDVFIIDWGTPGDEDRYLEFDTIVDRYLGRAVSRTLGATKSESVHLLGYCLGGTLTTIYAALHPENIASLVALAAPIKFADDGMLSLWTRSPGFNVDALVEAFGNVPWPLMQASFQLLKPTLNLTKTVQLIDRFWDDEFLDGFFALETWSNDNVAFPGAAYQKYIQALYREDALIKGALRISGQPVQLSKVVAPTLAVTFSHDHIVPEASAAVLLDHVGAPVKEQIRLSGGHVGAVISRKAKERLWPALSAWWAKNEPPAQSDEPASKKVADPRAVDLAGPVPLRKTKRKRSEVEA